MGSTSIIVLFVIRLLIFVYSSVSNFSNFVLRCCSCFSVSVTFVGFYELIYCGAIRLNIIVNVLQLKDTLESCRVAVR